MTNIIIDEQEIEIIEYKGVRVITAQTIAKCHNTEVKIINQKFRRNRKHFEISRDFFVVTKEEAFNSSGSQLFTQKLFTQNNMVEVFLFTESGYFKFVKTINDEKAWYIYQQLINSYFMNRKQVLSSAKFLAKSKEHRNDLTKEWEEHGAKNYVSLTLNSYNVLFQDTGIRKKNMDEEQLTLLSVFEYLEAMKLQNNQHITGDSELRKSSIETASGIIGIIENKEKH